MCQLRSGKDADSHFNRTLIRIPTLVRWRVVLLAWFETKGSRSAEADRISMRTLSLGVGTFAIELLILALTMGATWMIVGYLLFEPSDSTSQFVRASAAVATLLAWVGVCVAAVALCTQLGASSFGANRIGAIVIAAVLTAAALFWLLEMASVVNSCLWDVAFPLGPLGERYECGFD